MHHRWNELSATKIGGACSGGLGVSQCLGLRGSSRAGRRAVEASVLALAVEGPVGVPVVGEADGAEVEDGVGADGGPAHPGLLHAVLDEVAAGALDHAGADRPAAG